MLNIDRLNNSQTGSFFDYHPKKQKVTKYENVFRCKVHGRIDVKHDKLINVAGTKFCPFCLKDHFERAGICQLKKSKEPKGNGKRNR